MRSLTLLSAVVLSCQFATAQTPPPIHGVTGTVATDSTIRSEHDAAHTVAEGAAQVVNGAKKILSGGKGTDQDPLAALVAGSRVVMRDVTSGGDTLETTTEGVVVDVNRSRRQITVRLADKKTQTLRVMEKTAPAGARVIVSLADQVGAKTYIFARVG